MKYARYMTPVLHAEPIDIDIDLDDDLDDVDDSDSADFSTNSDRDSDIFGMNLVSSILILTHSTNIFKKSERPQESSPMQDVPITFLPLPSTFNHRDTASWAVLVNQISTWLVDTVRSPRCQEWGWGVEAFWMAFIAAYPSFPAGNWPSWETSIGADTRFFQQWLESGGRVGWCHQNDIRDDCLLAFLDKIWSLFCQHTSLFYLSIPL